MSSAVGSRPGDFAGEGNRERDVVGEHHAEQLPQPIRRPRDLDLLHLVPERAQELGCIVHRSCTHRIDHGIRHWRHGRRRDSQPVRPIRGRGHRLRPSPPCCVRRWSSGRLGERLRRRRRPRSIAELIAGEHVQDRRRVGDRAREHAVDPERGVAQRGGRRDAPATGLEAHEAAAGRGDTDRATAVGAVGDRHDAGRHGGRRSAGGATGSPLQVPWVAGRAEQAGLAGRQDPVLRQRRRADDDEARLPQAPRDVVVVLGHVIGHERTAVGESQALDRAVVLDRDRHPRKRAPVTGTDLLCEEKRSLGIDLDERVEGRVELLDSIE